MSRKAEQILEKMKQTKRGWHTHHFHTLYLGFGFILSGTKHDIFIHPDFPELRHIIPRHPKELASVYAATAVKNIESLRKLEQGKDETNE